MNKLFNSMKDSALTFAKEEDGAQVIEYALIIAVISIALVLALQGLSGGFAAFITRVTNCLTTGTAAACGAP